MESKNALWRRESQLRSWNTSETNSASATPRDRQLSAVKFQDACVFLAACSSCDTKEVTWLLGRGADINTANVDGLTALHQVSLVADIRYFPIFQSALQNEWQTCLRGI